MNMSTLRWKLAQWGVLPATPSRKAHSEAKGVDQEAARDKISSLPHNSKEETMPVRSNMEKNREFESAKDHILESYSKHNGNVRLVCEELDVSSRTMYGLLYRWGVRERRGDKRRSGKETRNAHAVQEWLTETLEELVIELRAVSERHTVLSQAIDAITVTLEIVKRLEDETL